MRAALLPLLVGVLTVSRTYRALRVAIGWYVRLARDPLTVTAVLQVALSVLVAMVKAPVFQPVVSPPSPACLTTNDATFCAEPRSTVSVAPATVEHHLLLFARLPSTALLLVSLEAHAADEVVGLFRARLVPKEGAAA